MRECRREKPLSRRSEDRRDEQESETQGRIEKDRHRWPPLSRLRFRHL